jgi:hypothetical protein
VDCCARPRKGHCFAIQFDVCRVNIVDLCFFGGWVGGCLLGLVSSCLGLSHRSSSEDSVIIVSRRRGLVCS